MEPTLNIPENEQNGKVSISNQGDKYMPVDYRGRECTQDAIWTSREVQPQLARLKSGRATGNVT